MDWNALRLEFPVVKRWAFFDHAAVAPLTRPAHAALAEWSTDMLENGDANLIRWVRRVAEIRQAGATLISADPSEIAFVKNTTEGISFVAEGFPWKAGDNVVTAAEEYPSNIYPWMNLKDRGVELRLVPSRDRQLPIEDLQQAVDSRTRIVSLSFVEFATGWRNDLSAIGEFCRKRGIYLFVDAIQGLGVLPLDVRQTPVDFLTADSHKWLLGPEGAGIFWIRKDLIELLHPISIGWKSVVGHRDFSTIDFRLKPDASRWESGTLNTGGIISMGGSIDLLLNIGIKAVWQRVEELTDYLCDQCQRRGFDVYSQRSLAVKSGIVSIVWPEPTLRALVKRCKEAGIIVTDRGHRLRVTPHCYNTTAELDRLIEVMSTSQDLR